MCWRTMFRHAFAAAALALPALFGPNAVRAAEPIKIGFSMPLTGGLASNGKAILAAFPEEEARVVLSTVDRVSRTPATLVSVPALLRELALVRTRGFAIDNEENELGTICVAAAFNDPAGRATGAISTSGPRWRVTDEIVGAMGKALVEACRSLGGLL